MTVQEAARALDLSERTVRLQIANGRLIAVKHGRDWWIEDAEVERYRRENRGRPGRPRK
jgi:excisionase family DNA binding protein